MEFYRQRSERYRTKFPDRSPPTSEEGECIAIVFCLFVHVL
jgi:hypothetical protein